MTTVASSGALEFDLQHRLRPLTEPNEQILSAGKARTDSQRFGFPGLSPFEWLLSLAFATWRLGRFLSHRMLRRPRALPVVAAPLHVEAAWYALVTTHGVRFIRRSRVGSRVKESGHVFYGFSEINGAVQETGLGERNRLHLRFSDGSLATLIFSNKGNIAGWTHALEWGWAQRHHQFR